MLPFRRQAREADRREGLVQKLKSAMRGSVIEPDDPQYDAARGGGHNAGGLGVCNDGLVIDLSGVRETHIDPVDHATHAFGLAVPSGVVRA